jgi:hypothetical protein
MARTRSRSCLRVGLTVTMILFGWSLTAQSNCAPVLSPSFRVIPAGTVIWFFPVKVVVIFLE